MEPAILYLVVLAGTAAVWSACDLAWALCLSLAGRHMPRLFGVARIVSVATAVMLFAAAWRASAASADVLPPAHREIVSEQSLSVGAVTALTFRTIVESTRHEPSSYTVKSGDCLWKIARATIVADGVKPTGAMVADFWQRIYETNSEVIGVNPRLIFPGQVLEIPER